MYSRPVPQNNRERDPILFWSWGGDGCTQVSKQRHCGLKATFPGLFLSICCACCSRFSPPRTPYWLIHYFALHLVPSSYWMPVALVSGRERMQDYLPIFLLCVQGMGWDGKIGSSPPKLWIFILDLFSCKLAEEPMTLFFPAPITKFLSTSEEKWRIQDSSRNRSFWSKRRLSGMSHNVYRMKNTPLTLERKNHLCNVPRP